VTPVRLPGEARHEAGRDRIVIGRPPALARNFRGRPITRPNRPPPAPVLSLSGDRLTSVKRLIKHDKNRLGAPPRVPACTILLSLVWSLVCPLPVYLFICLR
jgi:hypothetical protein